MGPPDGCQKKTVGGGVRLEQRLDVVGCSPVHHSEGQYQGLESDTGRDGKPVEGDNRSGVTWERLGRLKTRRVAAF